MEKLRVGIVGTGFGAAVQAPGFMVHPDWEVVALSGVSRPGRAQAKATEAGIPRAYDNYVDMLDHERLDLVSVASSPDHHSPMTLAALERGISVLCEKPMALNLSEARSMTAVAERTGLVNAIDHEFRYMPARAEFKRLVDEGYLGDLLHFTITYTRSGGAKFAALPMNWFSRAENGGGVLGAFGSHMIDQVHWCFGELKSVCAVLSAHVGTRGGQPVTADDSFAFLARLGGKVIGVFQFGTAGHHSFGLRLEAYGSKGTLVLNERVLLAGRAGEPLTEVTLPDYLAVPGVEFKPGFDPRIAPFAVMAHNLSVAIRGAGAPSPVPRYASFRDGSAIQAVLDAVRASDAAGCWVDVPAH